MKTWKVEVKVQLKPSVFDPQGNAVEQTLVTLGYHGFSDIRIGKQMSFTVTALDETEAAEKVDAVCATVLSNPVVETYTFEISEVLAGAAV